MKLKEEEHNLSIHVHFIMQNIMIVMTNSYNESRFGCFLWDALYYAHII